MPSKKSKKLRKYRGSKTHGGGSMKKRRGAGSRGGRGKAGTGKRADQKKPSILALFGKSYFGKKGFINKTRKSVKTMNLDYLEKKIPHLIKKKIAEEKAGTITIDLSKIKINKLLGKGKITKKYIIKVEKFSERAKKKIEEKGGSINAES